MRSAVAPFERIERVPSGARCGLEVFAAARTKGSGPRREKERERKLWPPSCVCVCAAGL